MTRPLLQHEALRSLSQLGRQTTSGTRCTLFARPAHVRAQQRRTYQWTSSLRSPQLVAAEQDQDANDETPQSANARLNPSTFHQEAALDGESRATQDSNEEKEVGEEAEVGKEDSGNEVIDRGYQDLLRPEDSYGEFRIYAEATKNLRIFRSKIKPYETKEEAEDAVVDALTKQLPPHEILFVLLRAVKQPDFLATLQHKDNEAYLRSILDIVRPGPLLEPFRLIYKGVHPSVMRYVSQESLPTIFGAFTDLFKLLLTPSGHVASKPARWRLRKLLELAKETGDARLARSTFRSMTKLPGRYRPDLNSYNYLLHTICWDGAHDAFESHKFRVTPMNIKSRAREKRKQGEIGHIVGDGGLQEEVSELVQKMQDDGHKPNTETWNAMMVALARGGDTEAVKKLIDRIWDVNINAVVQGDEGGLLFENRIAPESPTFPTQDTLFSVAHSFCINNQFAIALQTLDFFSRKYGLEIERRIWREMMEWAYILSTKRHGDAEQAADQRIGQLEVNAVENLWDMISAAPFNVELQMDLAPFLFRSALRRGQYLKTLGILQYASDASDASGRRLKRANYGWTRTAGDNPIMRALLRAEHRRDRHVARSFMRQLLSQHATRRLRLNQGHLAYTNWFHRLLPDVINKYSGHSHTEGNSYSVLQGRVQFQPPERAKKENVMVRLSQKKTLIPGVVVLQPDQVKESRFWAGWSTQQRLQERYAKRTSTAEGGSPPAYMPAWYETDTVRSWAPIASDVDMIDPPLKDRTLDGR